MSEARVMHGDPTCTVGDTDRYNTARLWVHAMIDEWTKEYISSAFKKTGLIPFNRNAHLVENKADIEIGDAIQQAEEMMKREQIRQQRAGSWRRCMSECYDECDDE